MLEELKQGPIVVGLKQLKKALKDHAAQKVFLARDAESRLTAPIEAQCETDGIAVVWVATMAELGAACGIEVGAAAAATLK
ncbi:MAG: 50S ribosomal protein L7ae-like protein [Oscillospiraceae bacterium]|nr:50S ribosomal protein L7ae-like protein [Oscillospiraceae bacterium]